MKPAQGGSPERIYGMDVWRGALLTTGLIVHCAALSDITAFNMIEDASHLCRMEAFFTISGFFAALTIGKAEPADWIRRRLVMLLVPLAVGLAAAVPLSHVLIADLAKQPGFMGGYLPWQPSDWHMHMWFLIALALYVPLTFALQAQDRRVEAFGRFAARRPLSTVAALWVAGLGASLAIWATGKALHVVGLQSIAFLLRQTTYFCFFYALGHAAFRVQAVRDLLLSPPRAVYAVAVMLAILDLAAVAVIADGKLRMLIFFVARPIVGFAVTSLVFRSAFSLRHCHKWQADLSNASYTIYLLHVPAILGLLWLLYPTGIGPWQAMAVIAPVALLILYYFHLLVVRRSSLLLLLLNGRRKATRKTATAR
ncbi:acyltransferase family protein [Sphingomonas sp. 22176]|uniref:acyltransferase family protein n=1 Tax=Sphingomonas sp. 22176 TaxID=3453884 RepID=UPI003F83BFF2